MRSAGVYGAICVPLLRKEAITIINRKNINLSETFKSLYPAFTKTEKVIADYFLGETPVSFDPESTLEEIAAQLKVGQSTVMRFIRKCGYNSLRAFNIDLATSIYTSDMYSRQHFQNDPNALFQDVTAQMVRFSQGLEPHVIEEIARQILQADVIVCTGIGYSAHIAELAAYRLIRSGFFAVCYTDHLKSWDIHTILRGKRAVMLAFTISGETPEIVDVVNHCRMMEDVYVAALTSFIHSTTAHAVQSTIYIPAQHAPNSTDANVDGLVNMLLAIETVIIKCFELREREKLELSQPVPQLDKPYFN